MRTRRLNPGSVIKFRAREQIAIGAAASRDEDQSFTGATLQFVVSSRVQTRRLTTTAESMETLGGLCQSGSAGSNSKLRVVPPSTRPLSLNTSPPTTLREQHRGDSLQGRARPVNVEAGVRLDAVVERLNIRAVTDCESVVADASAFSSPTQIPERPESET